MRVILTRSVGTEFFQLLVLKDKVTVHHSPGEHLAQDAAKKGKEGQSILLPPAVSQVPLIQNNQCAKMAYFGMTISELLQKK